MKIAGCTLALVPLLLIPLDIRGQSPTNGNGAPKGSCSAGAIYTENATGNIYSCLVSSGRTGSWQLAAERGSSEVARIQYVLSAGNDSKNGLTWGNAKRTVYAALEALPGGATSPPTAGSGKIEIQGTVSYGGPASDGGLWLFGSNDPNYSAGVSGWLRYTSFLTVECAVPNGFPAHGHIPICIEGWGGSADGVHPAFWFSSINGAPTLNNFGFSYPGVAGKIGIDSNNNRNGGGVGDGAITSLTLNNVSTALSCSVGTGTGPGIDIGSNSFWIYFNDMELQGCRPERWTISALARSSNVVTVTTSATNDVAVGETISLQNTTDPSFNGSYTVVSVIGSPQTQYTFAQDGPNSTSSGGQTFGASSAALAINPGSGSGSGLIFINSSGVNSGSVWLQPGLNGASLYVDGLSYEGDNTTPDTPPVLITKIVGSSTFAHISNVETSDTINNVAGVEVDGGGSSGVQTVEVERVYGAGPNPTIGGMTVMNGTYPATAISPLHQGQAGVASNRLIGMTDAGRRPFPPAAVRSANLANTNSTAWTYFTGSGTTTIGITAPDGTTNAAQFTSASGIAEIQFYEANSVALTVGDFYIFGGWARSQTANGLPVPAVKFVLASNGYGSGDYCVPPPNGSNQGPGATYLSQQYFTGDGEWEWTSGICKIQTNTNAASPILLGQVSATQSGQFYAPILLHFGAGSISDNEAYEITDNLASYGANCPTGSVCQLPTQELAFGGSGQFFGVLGHANTANRSYVFPDATGKIPYFAAAPSGCAQWGTGGQISGTNVNCETILTGRVTTTAAARDVVTVTGATSLSHCSLTATNASAAIHMTGTYISDYALNRVTVTHATVAFMTYDLLCTPN